MKKKTPPSVSLSKEELQKELKKKTSALEKLVRESEIETALERVRSRSMGMKHSDELKEVIQIVFDQFVQLNIKIEHTGFVMDYKTRDDYFIWVADPHHLPSQVTIPYFNSIYYNRFNEAKKNGETFFATLLDFDEKNEFYRTLFNYIPGLPEEAKEFYFNCPGLGISTVLLEDVCLYIENFSATPYTDQENDILLRFGKVFQQTYTRFNDLQKAEAQARESQIQLSLERVRARTMAMQRSEELADVALALFQQVKELGIQAWVAGFNIWQEDNSSYIDWVTGPTGEFLEPYTVELNSHPFFDTTRKARQRGDDFHISILEGQEIKEIYQLLSSFGDKGQFQKILDSGIQFPTRQINHFVFGAQVSLLFITYEPCPHAWDVFKRFGKVFEQTYTRFLDLQKAEAQARESQIQVSLERVRSRSMGMQKSDELREVIQVIYEQFIHLGYQIDAAGFNVDIRDSDDWNLWMTHRFALIPTKMYVPYFDHPLANALLKARNNGDQTFTFRLTHEEKNNMLDHVFDHVVATEDEKKGLYSTPGYFISEVLFKDVALFIENYEGRLYSADENAVLIRFGKAFEQAYIRFKDLKQAESQAREAKIEAGLERARTQSMLMQQSHELNDTMQVFHQQVQLLGINSDFSFLWLPDEENDKHVFWATWSEEKNGAILLKSKTLTYPLDRNEHYTAECLADWKGGVPVHTYKVAPAEVKNYFAAWQELLSGAEKLKPEFFSNGLDYVEAYMKYGCFGIVISRLLTEDEKEILRRFSIEFERAYTRFLDLQKAETSAREGQIELALERVRSRTMSMHHSGELADTASVLFQQIKELGFELWSCGFCIWAKDNMVEVWMSADSGGLLPLMMIPYMEEPTHHDVYIASLREIPAYEKIWEGPALEKHYDFLRTIPTARTAIEILENSGLSLPSKQCYYVGFFKQGYLLAITKEPKNEVMEITRRFTRVFEQTYTRFLDLKNAEAQALEAVKRASVDRVRAEIASMRTTNDLEKITPLIWNELIILGIPFVRCGVFIIDEPQELVHTFLSTREGKAIASFTSSLLSHQIIAEALPYWRRKEIFKAHWDETAFLEQTKILVDQGVISSTDTYLTENRPQNLYLNFFPFLQGILYVGNVEPLNDEHLQLVQALAEAFSTAYARYDDFNKLESANLRIEKTLVDLKQTQAQLVQSEKMASLGELTAGIAHEIQNPLNFVNNFSEVNRELLAELNVEIEKGNYDEVKVIASDLINNEEKISHHGKRADAIVKGMLQHSRSTSVTKEPTDINKLADEYLRLSYHGLRAKDKLFNAAMKCDFDEGIGNINVFPQDIGRVLLNLYNNAFYAVTEKKKLQGENYQPLVQVTTQKQNGTVEITVKDNGNGIPQKVRFKIFQPFFTTKPTGQGTGLGLSLSYDIVKAHGGEIKMDTNEGEFTEFIIQLPA